MTCIFCAIVAGEAQATILYRDELVTAFRDIHPVAATHILIVPNRHIDSLNAVEEGDADLLAHMLFTARRLAADQGVAESGYRLLFNTGADGGQTIYHLHLHLIAGKFTRFTLA
jgi:histidine triad (HIT) family protein